MMRRILVVGGGIAGLAAAHHVLELSRTRGEAVSLTLLEARDRLGGTIATERVGGFLVERGPDSFLSDKPWGLDLARQLGLADQLVGTDEQFRRTFVVHRGRLHALPDGFQLLAPTRLWPFLTSSLFSWQGKFRITLDLVLPRGFPHGDESLGAFVRRRLGREALERVAQPLVAGIYTADAERLSLAATMPRFLEAERQHRSLVLALWRAARRADQKVRRDSGPRWSLFITFRDGMEVLVRALAATLPREAVRLGHGVREILVRRGNYTVRCENGEVMAGDAVIVATEAHRAGVALRPVDGELARLLLGIPYASSATISLAYRHGDVGNPLDAFGFVVPAGEGKAVMACTFSSSKYPGRAPEGCVLLRAFVGGATGAPYLEASNDDLAAMVRRDLEFLLDIRGSPVLVRVHRHPEAMPQYEVGHLERLHAIEERVRELPGLALAGAGYYGVGIPDCIRSGQLAAEMVFKNGS